MNIDQGRLSYATGIDNSQLRTDAQESRNILAGIGQAARQEGERMDSMFANIGKAIGGYFAVGQVKSFISEIMTLRSEVQSLEISFETLLQSKTKGQTLFSEIRQFAVATPMMVKDLASGAQTMLAFNIEAEKVMPMLRAIGDISMGNAQNFNSLTLAFSQMSASGKLMGQDLLQMINAGFNPLSVISQKTGKSIGELKEKMEKGGITVEMVEDAFISATSAGGQFHGMLEKQSHGLQGAMSNLQGAIDDMFNDIGTAGEDAAADVLSGATSIVHNYRQVGEVLAGIVATYGTYKAAIMATEAVRRTVSTIRHTEEAAQLYELMTAEQKEKISKLGLAESSAAYRQAIVAEMEAELQRQQQLAASAEAELTVAQERLTLAEAEVAAATETVAARQAELDTAIASATAEQQASLRAKIAIESEKQSRVALRIVKLQEQKDSLIAQARALKETKASSEIIAAKNREIATISQKITAARAEEVQHSRNVVALRNEMKAQADATTSKKIAAAEAKLLTAQEELSTAAKTRNTLATDVQSGSTKAAAAAKSAETLQTEINTAAQNVNASATGFLSIAKTKLTAVAARLNAVIMANPWAIAAAAVAALGYGIYKLATYQTDAQKSTENLNNSWKEAQKEIALEEMEMSRLFEQLRIAKKGTEEYDQAKQAILSRYGNYLNGLSKEIASLNNVAAAYDAVRNAAIQAAQARQMQAYVEKEMDRIADKQAKYRETIYDELKKKFGDRKTADGTFIRDRVFNQMMDAVRPGSNKRIRGEHLDQYVEEHTTFMGVTYSTNKLKDAVNGIYALNNEVQNVVKGAERKYGQQYAPPPKTPTPSATTPSVAPGKPGKTGGSKSGSTGTSAQNDAAQIALQEAERKRKIREYAEAVVIARKEAELEIRQNDIDLMEEGVDKQLEQIRLNYDRLEFANMKREEEMVEKLRDIRALEWERDNPKAKEKGLTFDRSTITAADLSDEEKATLAEYARVATQAREKAEAEVLKKMLSDVATYEEQRLKIEKEYAKKRDALAPEQDTGNGVKTRKFEKGVTQGHLDELDRQEQEALKAIDEQFAQREEAYKAWCEKIATYSIDKLQQTLKTAKENLASLEGSDNPDSVALARARAEINKLRAQIAAAKARQPDPAKRTLKEWEDLHKVLSEVESKFEGIGDTFKGVVGDVISECGKLTTSTLSMINSIIQLQQWSVRSAELAAMGASKAVQTVEKASVILTIISAAMQIAMQIVNMFNTDNQRQEEIDALQSRIDQLQWELDNAEAIRIQQALASGSYIREVCNAVEDAHREILEAAAATDNWRLLFEALLAGSDSNTYLLTASAEKLAKAYANVAYSAGKALGNMRYGDAEEELQNLAKQQILIQQQIDAEQAKKKTDSSAIEEWERKIAELGQQAVAIINDMVEEIIGDTSSGIAEQLADAFFNAFAAGEDAAKAWGDKVNDIVADVLKRMLVQKFLEQPLGEIFDKYKSKWFADGKFAGIDSIIDSMQGFANDLNSQFNAFKTAMDALPDDIKNYFTGDDQNREASKKGIATASQDSIDELNGRMTAIQSHTFSINETTRLLLSSTQAILHCVMNIESETSGFGARLARMEGDIKGMAASIDDIALKGIRLKK